MAEYTGWFYYNGKWHGEPGAPPLSWEIMTKSPGFDEFYFDTFIKPIYDAVGQTVQYFVNVSKIIFEIGASVVGVSAVLSGIFWKETSLMLPKFETIGKNIADIIVQAISDTAQAFYIIGDTVVNLFKEFLRLIHFHELLQVHNILYTLFPKYREWVNFVYYRISQVSEALGFTPQFINLALRNARAIVLTASNMLGRPYDLADLEYWSKFEEFTGKIGGKFEQYENDPESLFNDIDQWIIRDASNDISNTNTVLFQTISDITDTVTSTIEDVKVLRDEVGEFQSSLPESIQKYTRPIIDPVLNKFDDFYYDTYRPTIDALGIQVDDNSKSIFNIKQDLQSINLRMETTPVKLFDWDKMNDQEKKQETEKLEDLSTSPYQETVDQETADNTEREQELLKPLIEKKEEKPKEAVAITPETVRPKKEIPPLKPYESWFVGDF